MQRYSQLSLVVLIIGSAALAGLAGLQADSPPTKPSQGQKESAGVENRLSPAVKPKPLTAAVDKGLAYLINQQNENGGWGQGGGWRNNTQAGGRVEGANVADPPDVANTCIATLALLRAGHTPSAGKYAKNVARAVDFICANVEKADAKSLFVTTVRGTQVQGKIGPYVDTFLTSLVLAEIKGRMPDDTGGKRLVAALNKTIGKIEDNLKADGTFAGNDGWAPVLSEGLAVKALNRSAQAGAMVKEEVLARTEKKSVDSFDPKSGTVVAATSPATSGAGARFGGFGGRAAATAGPRALGTPAAAPSAAVVASDAGVPIYSTSNNVAGLQDAVNTNRILAQKAREVVAKADAPKADKDKALGDLKRFAEVEKVCDQATQAIVTRLKDKQFIQGFGSNGGEEFLSYMNISEALVVKGGNDWETWDRAMSDNLTRIQDKDGGWSGSHCITGKTFCTGTALLVLMADRAPVPVAAKMKTGR